MRTHRSSSDAHIIDKIAHTIRMEEQHHDYHDTIKEAAEIEDGGEAPEDRERRLDSEAAYEVLAVTSSMGMLGMENQAANLLQLELAQELLYNLDPDTHNNDDTFNR